MPSKESRTGRQYERLVAAIFRSDGQLVERNRKTPGGRIAEVDVLAWRPEHNRLVCTLVECKCEQKPPKPNDLLLLKGRQALVDADRAVLVTAKPFSLWVLGSFGTQVWGPSPVALPGEEQCGGRESGEDGTRMRCRAVRQGRMGLQRRGRTLPVRGRAKGSIGRVYQAASRYAVT